jgi:hypothetical protein
VGTLKRKQLFEALLVQWFQCFGGGERTFGDGQLSVLNFIGKSQKPSDIVCPKHRTGLNENPETNKQV